MGCSLAEIVPGDEGGKQDCVRERQRKLWEDEQGQGALHLRERGEGWNSERRRRKGIQPHARHLKRLRQQYRHRQCNQCGRTARREQERQQNGDGHDADHRGRSHEFQAHQPERRPEAQLEPRQYRLRHDSGKMRDPPR